MIPAALLLILCFLLFKCSYLHCLSSYVLTKYLQSLPLYTSSLFSVVLIEDIIDIEKPDGKCSLIFVVNEF